MAITIISIIILAVIFIALLVGIKSAKSKGTRKVLGVLVAVTILAAIIVPQSFRTVDTGEIAVVKYLGEAVGTRSAGTHFDLWLTTTYQVYDAKVQNVDIVTAAYSSDAQTMDVTMTLQYQVMADKVMDIAKQYGSLEILENRIHSIAIEKSKAVLSSYTAMNIISDRAAMSPAVELAIKDAIGDEYFVNVTAVVLTNIDFSDAFEQAVEEKMIAEQKQLKAEYENTTKVAQAEAEAKAALIAAEAQAQAELIAAEAAAKANEMLEKSLTEKVLQQKYIDKWNGELPNVMTGDDPISVMVSPDMFTE